MVADILTVRKRGTEFSLEVDVSPMVEHYGPGIYTLVLWATIEETGEEGVIAKFPIWWKTEPQAGDPYRKVKTPPATGWSCPSSRPRANFRTRKMPGTRHRTSPSTLTCSVSTSADSGETEARNRVYGNQQPSPVEQHKRLLDR